MSGSIGESDFQVAKDKISELIGKICGTIGLQVQNNRAAVITFSRDVTENFDFDDHDNLASLQAAVRDMPFEGKGTCTGDALDLAKTMFSPSKGARPDVISVKEVVVLTDGKSNCGTDATTAARALQNSRNPPVSMFVFAISDFDADGRREIESMSSHPASVHLFTFVSITDFEDVVNVILTYPKNCAPVVIAP